MDAVTLDLPPELRTLAPPESPFSGTLRAGDPPLLWTDAEAFGLSPAWAAAGAEHLLAPVDAARTPEGPRVALPHCSERLEAALERGAARTPGAAVTVAVSALRAAVEADALEAANGTWWVTSAGRPVLALTGSIPWRPGAVAALEQMSGAFADAPLATVLQRVAAALGEDRSLRRDSDALEEALFVVSAPGPLTGDTSSGSPPTPRSGETRSAAGSSDAEPAGRGLVLDAVARLVDTDLAMRVRGALGAVLLQRPHRSSTRQASRRRRGAGQDRSRASSRPSRRALPSSRAAAAARRRAATEPVVDPTPHRRGRRGVVMVGLGAAAVVLVVGALWPAEEGASIAAAKSSPAPASAAPVEADASASATPRAADPSEPGLVGIGRTLVDAVVACAEAACEGDLWEDPAAARAIPAARGDYRLEVVDEYGGVAALRATSSDATQIIVIVQDEKQWLVREVYDLADQP